MHVSIAQANLPKMYLDYSPISMLFFLSTCGLCSRSLYTSLWGGEKMYFLVHKVIRNRSIWGPCQFLIFITKHLVICFPIYLSGNMKEFIWKKSGKVKNLYGKCEGLLKKHRQLYGKMPNLTEKAEEFIWQKFGKVKNSYGNVKELYKEQ